MPTSYYKYAERAVENQIDWSQVGKEFSTMLKTTADLREQKKADIEKATQENLKVIADAPTGLDERVTDKMINLSSQSQDYLLMMNRMLKSGQLSPKDYSIASQNLKTDVSSLFDLSKKYQTEYADYIQRAQSGIANPFETWNKEKIESFTNFSKMDFIINTPTGTLSSGIKTKDPITGQEVVNYNQTLPQLKWAQGVKMDKFDTQGSVDKIVNSLGEESKIIMQGRILEKISDITKRPSLDNPAVNAYKIAEKNFVNGIIDTNPFNAQSILMMDKGINSETGNAYYLTDDPNDKGLKTHDAILVIPDPASPGSGRTTVKLDDVQKQTARDLLTQRIRIGIDKSMEGQYIQPQQPTEASLNRQDKEKEAQVFGEMLGKYVNPKSAEEFDAAKAYFNNIEGLEGLSKGATAIDVFKNGKLLRTNYGPNSDMRSLAGSLIPALNVNGLPEATIRKYALMQGGGVNTQLTGKAFKQSTVPPKEDPLGQFNKYVDAYIGSTVKDTEEDTVPLLRARFGKLGYTFEETGAGKDIVLITGPDKTSVEIDLSSSNAAGEIADFMKGNTDIKKIGLASGMGSLSLPKQKKSSQKPTVTGGIVR